MVKRLVAIVLTLAFFGLLTVAPDALAKRQGGEKPVPSCEDIDPLCHPED